jgi:hypothetical protein
MLFISNPFWILARDTRRRRLALSVLRLDWPDRRQRGLILIRISLRSDFNACEFLYGIESYSTVDGGHQRSEVLTTLQDSSASSRLIGRHGATSLSQGSAIVEVRIGAIMTKGRPESYPPAQSPLEAVWCVGHSKYGLPDHSCRFCRKSFPQVEGLWKYAVGRYICGDCRDRALKLPKKS